MLASLQNYHRYSVHFAPRGSRRMAELGMNMSQLYLSAFDKLIGLIGDAGSGKSMVIKGMFPGLELTNDDEGVNVRPLPLLTLEDEGFYTAHTYHLDIKFESGFTQMHLLADAINLALALGKRVIVEHFELIYPFLGRNADLIVGVGEEIIVTRPTIFGPEPEDVSKIVFKSIIYRRMAHSAEDICELVLEEDYGITQYKHADIRRGFVLVFGDKPEINLDMLESRVIDIIKANIDISFLNENHITIGESEHYCTGPRNHVSTTGKIAQFSLIKEITYDPVAEKFLIVGSVAKDVQQSIGTLNKFENIL